MKGKELQRDNFCFVCGQENPKGMHLKFNREKDRVYSRFSLGKYYQGYNNVIHGGIISLLLDEAMAYLQNYEERFLTGRITIRFYNPLFVDEEVEVTAKIKEERKKVKITTAKMVRASDGKKIAEAEAIMFVKRENQ